MPHSRINGFQMYHDERGDGDALAYIHGGFPSLAIHLRASAGAKWGWELDFARSYRFILHHRRGCWLSERTDSGYDIETQAADLAKLLDHLGTERAHIVGTSAGGPIAIAFAAMYPQRTKSLVLGGTGAHLFPATDPFTPILRQQADTLRRGGHHALWDARPEGVETSFAVLWEREEMRQRGTLKDFDMRQRMLHEAAASVLAEERALWYATEVRAMEEYVRTDVTAMCGAIVTPRLVVHGAKDREVPVE